MKLKHILIATLTFISAVANGATIGVDLANDPAYNSGWLNGTDGGTPASFGAWSLVTGGVNSGHFIGDSTTLSGGNTGADINTTGESFGMYGHSGETSEAYRDFNGSTLGVGQAFSLELAVNFRNGDKGFDLRDSSDNVIFNFNIGDVGSGDDYTVQFAATGNGTIGNTYSANTEFALYFVQTSGSGGTWSITRSGGVSDFDSGTYSGVAENFKLYNSQTSSSAAENNLYANNFQITPEPSRAMLLGLCLVGLIFPRRR